MKRRTDTMRVMIISHDRATIRALKIALGKKTEDISEIASAYSLNEYAADIITGIILFFILGSEFFINYRLIWRGHHKEVQGK